jgi:hypothetical protein
VRKVSSRVWGVAIATAIVASVPACGSGSTGQDRWVVTENAAVEIDWDAISVAYREAEGPEDFERRVNEIYMGDEVISVAVRDVDAKTQEVSGFFDRNTNGKEEDGEKVFSIRRDIVSDQEAQVQIQGYGSYAGYHSPIFPIMTGMMLGSMMSRAFSPGYVPMYTTPYVTNPSRYNAIAANRSAYRQANPDKVSAAKASKSGRAYGSKGNGFGGGRATPSRAPRSRGGARFGASLGRGGHGGSGRRVIRLS